MQHFQMEQDYGKLKQWLLNRLAIGKGVLCGMHVSIDGNRLCVDAGVAIDGLGREIIVPARACIDPITQENGCCSQPCGDAPTVPARNNHAAAVAAEADALPPAAGQPARTRPAAGRPDVAQPPVVHPVAGQSVASEIQGIYTLWVCFRECRTDFQPVLVSDCEARERCAPGTIVETYCLKVTPGLPLQSDPRWCAKLWHQRNSEGPAHPEPSQPTPAQPVGGRVLEQPARPMIGEPVGVAGDRRVLGAPVRGGATWTGLNEREPVDLQPNYLGPCGGVLPQLPSREEIDAALKSRRHQLCEVFDHNCQVADEDPCVPLAAFMMRAGRIGGIDSCLVRPNIYSNEMLFDMILCLMERIDECCDGKKPPGSQPMRVRSVDFVYREPDGQETLVATMQNPLADTPVDINGRTNAIRIRFDKPFAQDQHVPSTHGVADPDFQVHNVQVLPDQRLNPPYVPGTLVRESADTVRFDLSAESRYSRGANGWQKGRYRLFLRGNEDLANNRQALADQSGSALDGEPIALGDNVISGDKTPGGDFSATFTIGGVAPPAEPMRVRSVEFIYLNAAGAEEARVTMASARVPTWLEDRVIAVRIRFSTPFAQTGANRPTTHGMNDPDFRVHNVQVQVAADEVVNRGIAYVPGTLQIEGPDTLRFNFVRSSPIVDAQGFFPSGLTHYVLFLRGNDDPANNRPALNDAIGKPLDGEPITPAGGLLSGDTTPGGDFSAPFEVQTLV